jgi:RNA polymerase sigma-70 factor (ECF subfamily)
MKDCAILAFSGELFRPVFSEIRSVHLDSQFANGKQNAALLCLPFCAFVHAGKEQKKPASAEVYWLHRVTVDFYSFDEEYLRRLGARDSATEAHFVAYFSDRLKIILRSRKVDFHAIQDIIQETFYRVLTAVQAGKINNPLGFGSYVNSVAKNVLSEALRGDHRNQHDPLESTDVIDEKLSLDNLLERKEARKLVLEILSELPERDRLLLQARFFEDRDNEEVCADFGVDRDYLRVLFHRAIHKFAELYRKKQLAVM